MLSPDGPGISSRNHLPFVRGIWSNWAHSFSGGAFRLLITEPMSILTSHLGEGFYGDESDRHFAIPRR